MDVVCQKAEYFKLTSTQIKILMTEEAEMNDKNLTETCRLTTLLHRTMRCQCGACARVGRLRWQPEDKRGVVMNLNALQGNNWKFEHRMRLKWILFR